MIYVHINFHPNDLTIFFSISGWGLQRGGGNRNGGRYKKPKISKEELDSELDLYMKHTQDCSW